MIRSARLVCAAVAMAATLGGCAALGIGGSWTTIVDGTDRIASFDKVGQANWSMVDGALQATMGGKDPAYLVTRQSYRDFKLRAEFWSSDDANSGIFFRCAQPSSIGDETCYEANIFDQRPDQTYATGAIVKIAPVAQPAPKAGGKWNTFEITAKGTRLVVVLNGVTTVDVENAKLASGPIALQWGRGTIRFRKVEIQPL